jgi:hypothetical protein
MGNHDPLIARIQFSDWLTFDNGVASIDKQTFDNPTHGATHIGNSCRHDKTGVLVLR